MNKKGFTLAELLVVIALIGTILAIAAPAITKRLAHNKLVSATRVAMVELNAARLKAITRNVAHRVEFTLGGTDSYRMYRYNTGSASWEEDPERRLMTIDAAINISSPGANFRVTFNTNGTATYNDNAENASICLQVASDASDRMKITVDKNLGKTTVTTGC